MANKRSQQSVPSAETGAIKGDGRGRQSIAWVNKGGRNATTNEARRGAGGMAPKPSGGAALPGNDRPGHPTQAGLARVRNVGGSGPVTSHLPVQNNAMRNLTGQAIGQPNPNTGAAATSKPKRKGLGSAFFGEY